MLRSVGSPGDDSLIALRNCDLAVARLTDMGWAELKCRITLADMGFIKSSVVYCPVSVILSRVSRNERVPVPAVCSSEFYGWVDADEEFKIV